MFKKVKNYIQDQVTLAKLEVVEVVGKVAATAVFFSLIALFSLFFIILLSIAIGFLISAYLGYTYGFLIIAGFYFLLLILFFIFKKSLKNMITNLFVATAMKGNKN